MKGDFTRLTDHPERHYRGVLLQQGRVQLDADWNEQQEIDARRVETGLSDLVGAGGAPGKTAGFGLATSAAALPAEQVPATAAYPPLVPGDFFIAAGRYYVDGVLCQNEAPVPYTRQPDFPGAAAPTTPGTYVAYLDVWLRHVTALEDPALREVALGGPDTATRAKIVWQVKLRPIADAAATCTSNPDEWTSLTAPSSGRLTARAQPAESSSDPCLIAPGAGYRALENQLYRVEIHDPGELGTARFKWSRDNGAIAAAWLGQDGDTLTVSSAGRDQLHGFAEGDWVELVDDARELQGLPGVLVQLTAVEGQVLTIAMPADDASVDREKFPLNPKVRRWNTPGTTGTVLVDTPSSDDGYLVLENGVQVKFEAGRYATGDYWLIPARTATGDIEWPAGESRPPDGIAHHYSRLGILHFDGATYTSVSDCRRVFPAATELLALFNLGGDGQSSAPGQTLPLPLRAGVANGQWPVPGATVRFLVSAGTGSLDGVGATTDVVTGTDGVAECRWTLDAATPNQQVTATLVDTRGGPAHLPVRYGATLGTSSLDAGIHVLKVALADGLAVDNDTEIAAREFALGLLIECDAEVAATSVSRATCGVTVELPFPVSDPTWGNAVVGFRPIALDADVSVSRTTIAWTPAKDAASWLSTSLFPTLRRLGLRTRLLTRLTLSGAFIWSAKDTSVFLDGETFGTGAGAGAGRHTAITWPSGDGRRGGALQMWFWLTEPIAVSVSLSGPVVFINQTVTATVVVDGTDDKAVEMSVNGVVGGNSTVGTVTVTENPAVWIYKAPARVPTRSTMTITATSLADRTKQGQATISVLSRIIIEPPVGLGAEPAEGGEPPLPGADGAAGAPRRPRTRRPALGKPKRGR